MKKRSTGHRHCAISKRKRVGSCDEEENGDCNPSLQMISSLGEDAGILTEMFGGHCRPGHREKFCGTDALRFLFLRFLLLHRAKNDRPAKSVLKKFA
jgi:hypothetical protein